MNPILSIDSMKLTKDVVNNQTPVINAIDQIFSLYKANYPALTHIAISVPISSNTEFISHGNNPSPLTVENFEELWVSKIHSSGWNVIFRGTFCDAEGIYNFPITKADGAIWKTKILAYIDRITPFLKSGDIIAILPESTNNAFNGNLFLTGTLPDAYNAFFADLITSIKTKLANVGVVHNGIPVYITNNYTEIVSGWAGGIPRAEGAVVVDHYGSQGINTTATTMKADIESIQKLYGFPVFLQEFGDIWGIGIQYMQQCATTFNQEISNGTMLGINWWVGWDSPTEGILTDNNGTWSLNAKGIALKPYLAGVQPIPLPTIPAFVYNGNAQINYDTKKFTITVTGSFK